PSERSFSTIGIVRSRCSHTCRRTRPTAFFRPLAGMSLQPRREQKSNAAKHVSKRKRSERDAVARRFAFRRRPELRAPAELVHAIEAHDFAHQHGVTNEQKAEGYGVAAADVYKNAHGAVCL